MESSVYRILCSLAADQVKTKAMPIYLYNYLKLGLLFSLLCFAIYQSAGQDSQESPEKRIYTTAMVTDVPPVIDGLLDDEAWDLVEWGGGFIGHRPNYMSTPSEQTQFKILYDAKFLYVGIRAFDHDHDKIVKRMSRRDGFEGDWVEINIDSYFDKRTAFSFTASVSGVKGDEYATNNGNNWDSTWDPIWYLKTSVDEEGWIAEFKIPLSQLRFADLPEHTWGLQVQRRIFRREERSTWQPVSPQAPGWVHLFGELKGIKGIRPQKQLEIQPYVVGQLDKFPEEEGDPYRDSGTAWDGNLGVDAKVGITSDITLDMTVNPDFGQVEADPSVVNLTALEQFFPEQRPFFLEGNNLFSFRTSGGPNNLFYSRRIGAPAHGSVTDDDVSYTGRVPNTRILSAAKVTGKNSKGFSWGLLGSLTGQVKVEVTDSLGRERKEKIEPYSMYTSGRFQQDYKEGQTVVGGMFNHMQRWGNTGNELELLHNNAQSAGVDLVHNIFDRKYRFTLQFSGSRVEGSEEAIENTQRSFVRNFQRPDNDYRDVDTTLTTLTGTSSRFQFGKRSGDWVWELGVNHRSPGLELNDQGFLSSTDNINPWFWTQYRILKETKIFRSQRYNFNYEQAYDFGGTRTYTGFGTDVFVEFKNLWSAFVWTWTETMAISNTDLRGGPAFRNPGGIDWGFGINTNRQNKVWAYFRPAFGYGQDGAYQFVRWRFGVGWRPTDAMLVRIDPNIRFSHNDVQYVQTLDINDQSLYILGRVEQATYNLSIRANYNLTPNLTLEFWGQPFIAVGEYSEFKEVTESTNSEYNNRFRHMGNEVRRPTDAEIQDYVDRSDDFSSIDDFPELAYGVFKTNGTQMDTYFDDPDFNIVNFRSNLVLRWEYIPGSTLFVVWSSNSSIYDQDEENNFSSMTNKLWDMDASSSFLIKYTYRFIL